MRYLIFGLLNIIAYSAIPAAAETVVVEQRDKAFSKTSLTVRVGDTVAFKNSDPFFHNVFSLSDAKLFDLGSYPQGESREVVFDSPGEVEVECAVHPEMMLLITVE